MVMGVRPDIDGLIVDPCIPRDWPQFSMRRQFRNATYHILVLNPHHRCHGVYKLQVNGEWVEGNKIPLLGEGEHQVVAILGDGA